MIELKNVSKYYNNNGVVTLGLRNVNLSLSKGEIVAIVGESGSGKSTLLNVICGVDTYEEGEILFKGNETSYFNQNDMDIYRKRNVSFIYQSYNIIDSYTVLENVMLPLIIKGLDFKEAKARALELIKRVGLDKRVKHRGIKLSGGEKQRCVIARALASDCEILACDEPTGNLDSETGKEIIRLIKEVAEDKLVLIVTHNYEQVEDIVSRTIKVSDGEIIEDYKKEKIEDHLTEEMDLSLDKVKQKSLFRISLQNIKSTPKKNIFSLCVFFVLSLIGLFLYLSCVQMGEDSQYNPYQDFSNTVHNRLIVYSDDHQPLDMSKLEGIKGSQYKNAFYEDFEVQLRDEDYGLYLPANLSNYMPKTLKNKKGEFPQKDNDIYVVLPAQSSYYLSELKRKLNQEVNVNMGIHIKRFNLCGYAVSEELLQPLCVTFKDFSSDFIYNYLSSVQTATAEVDGKTVEIKKIYRNYSTNKPTLFYSGPSEKKITNLKATLNELYEFNIDERDYTLVYVSSEDEDFHLELTDYNLPIDEVFELTIYADHVDSAIRTIEATGYSYYQPAKSGFVKQSFNYIIFILYLFLSTLAMLALTFVSYVILARVYASKNKDYTILRSLGLVKKQMSKIVNYEVVITGFVSTVLAVIVLYIASIFVGGIQSMLIYNSVWFMLPYFALMLLFAYLISRRFNRRLFKFTVSTSIKGEVVRND